MKRLIQIFIAVVLLPLSLHAQSLEQSFRNPPDTAKCWVYWWWMHGWIDEAGIRADLDHMKEVGISGALVFQAGGGETPFKTEFLSDRWQELFRYAVEQAALRDIEIGLNLCDGWDAGGPWVTPEYSMITEKGGYRKNTMGSVRGNEIDPYNAAAMDHHWKHTVGKILDEAGEAWVKKYVGSTFKYTHIDSWERGYPNTSRVMAEEFSERRGYALGSEAGARYDEDFHRTLTEIWADNYYGRMTERSHALGLQTHAEAGGWEKSALLDAVRYFGAQDIVMSEYWSRATREGRGLRQVTYPGGVKNYPLKYHDHLKTSAAAAHVYGKKIVQAEAYTLWAPGGGYVNFSMGFWEMKDIGDRAFCLGMNRNVFHHMIAQTGEGVQPGYTWTGVGSDYLRTNSLWPMGKAVLEYKNRAQYLLQQGTYVADFLYFHGNHVPVTMPSTFFIKPALPAGYDADLVNAHALLTRASVKNERIVFPDGQSYKYLVLRKGELKTLYSKKPVSPTDALTVNVMKKLHDLVKGGVTLIGPPPSRSFGVVKNPDDETRFDQYRQALWGETPGTSGMRKLGSGRVIWGMDLAQVVEKDQILPDLEIMESAATQALPATVKTESFGPGFGSIHRRFEGQDIYFVANLRTVAADGTFIFRNSGPLQIWDPIDGAIYDAPAAVLQEDGRTRIALNFEPRQSLFVVFGNENKAGRDYHHNRFVFDEPIEGAWRVSFDPEWGGPESIEFPKLSDWTKHENPGIKYYSGTARYRKTFDLPVKLRNSDQPVYLNLGTVKEIAEVRLNGERVGIVWSAPFQIDISSFVKDTGNVLEIDVANVFANRILGDSVLKENYTTTNAKVSEQLFPSGLLGPVKLGSPGEPAIKRTLKE